jgi:hypothetical protein
MSVTLETWEDVKVDGITRCIDLAFSERDPSMRDFFFRNLMLAKFFRAALLDGSRDPY